MSGASLRRIGNFLLCDAERGTWPGRLDFLFAATSNILGLSIIWRFPYLTYAHGGADFFIPYIFFILVIGLPLLFLEISVGQFTSQGPIQCWRYSHWAQGIGLAMVVLSGIVSTYYSVVCGTIFYYLFASFTSKLPWTECGKDWRTTPCVDDIPRYSGRIPCARYNGTDSYDGGCDDSNGNLFAVWNISGSVKINPRYIVLQTSDYLHRHVLQDDFSTGMDDLGPVVWHMALCSMFVWLIVALTLSKSVKSYGKVVYVTTICPLVILVVLFIYGLTLDGHHEGFKFLTTPDRTKLHEYKTWEYAAHEVFFKLTLSFGCLSTMSSYNRFNSDTLRNATLLCCVQTVVAILSSITVFFFIGALAKNSDTLITGFASTGYTLIFVVMPEALLTTGHPVLWTILWFLMMANLAFGVLICMVETVVTAILDVFPRLRRFRILIVGAVCSLLFLIGLPLTTKGGAYLLHWLDVNSASWNLLLLPVAQIVALLIYGIPRFLNDVELMIGRYTFWCLPVVIGKVWMGVFLFLPTLAGVLFINVAFRLDVYTDPDGPIWAVRLGKAITWNTPVILICGALLSIFQVRKQLNKDIFAFLWPTRSWGPALAANRYLVKQYVPWFVVNPYDEDLDALTMSEVTSSEVGTGSLNVMLRNEH